MTVKRSNNAHFKTRIRYISHKDVEVSNQLDMNRVSPADQNVVLMQRILKYQRLDFYMEFFRKNIRDQTFDSLTMLHFRTLEHTRSHYCKVWATCTPLPENVISEYVIGLFLIHEISVYNGDKNVCCYEHMVQYNDPDMYTLVKITTTRRRGYVGPVQQDVCYNIVIDADSWFGESVEQEGLFLCRSSRIRTRFGLGEPCTTVTSTTNFYASL